MVPLPRIWTLGYVMGEKANYQAFLTINNLLAAVMLTSRLGSTRPSIAQGWELEIISMVILGGVSVWGGKGSIAGIMLAAIVRCLVNFGLGLLNLPGIVMSIVAGTLLIVVVAIPALGARWHART